MRSLTWILVTLVLVGAKKYSPETLPDFLDWDHILYGVGSGVICFGTVLDISRNDEFGNSLNAYTTSSDNAFYQHYGVRRELFWMRVGGVAELLWANSTSNHDGTHEVTLYHVKRFFTMSNVPFNRFNGVVRTSPMSSLSANVALLTLPMISVDETWFTVDYHDSKDDDELFAHSKGTPFKEKILLKREYEELTFVGFERVNANKNFTILDLRNWKVKSMLKANTGKIRGVYTTLQAIVKGRSALKYYKGPNYHLIKVLYNMRRNLIDDILPMTFSNFYYVMGKGEKGEGGGKEEIYPLTKGSTVIIARNGWLCAVKIVKDKYLADIVYRMREIYPCHTEACISTALKEQVFLASATGEETIALVTTPTISYYGVYHTRPSASTNHMCYKLDRKKMIQVPQLKGPVRGMDFKPSDKTMIISVKKAQLFKMNIAEWKSGTPTIIGTEKLSDLDLTDHFTGEMHTFASTPNMLPWHIFNTHKLMRTEENIQWLPDGNRDAAKTLATYSAQSIDYMLYFTDAVADTSWIRQNTLFGVKGCTLFAGGRPEDLGSVTAQFAGCKYENDEQNQLKTRTFLEQPKDDAGFMTLTWLVEKTKSTAIVFQTRIAIPRGKKQFTLDLTEEDAWQKGTITLRTNTFNLAFVKDDEVHYNVEDASGSCMFEKRAIGSEQPPVRYNPHIFDCKPDKLKSALVDSASGETFTFLRNRRGQLIISSEDEEALHDMNAKEIKNAKDTRVPKDAIPTAISDGLFAYQAADDHFVLTDLYNDRNNTWELKNVSGLRSIGFYHGPFYQARTGGKYKCILTNCHRNAIVSKNKLKMEPATSPASLKPFAEFEVEETVGVVQKQAKKTACSTSKRPFFVAFMVKFVAVDLLLTLVFGSILLVHRMYIIPARRRFKIVSSVMKNRKKRALRKRAARRLKKLNVLKRRLEHATKRNSRSDSSSSTENTLITAVDNKGPLRLLPTNDNLAPTLPTPPPLFMPSLP